MQQCKGSFVSKPFVNFCCRCPVLMVTGDKASFNHTVHTLYGSMSQKLDKGKIELLEVEGVANVLEEKVGFQSFLWCIFNHKTDSWAPKFSFPLDSSA